MTHPSAAGFVADLQARLDAVADPGTKAWFENYLKHAIGYRGVKTPVVARVVAEWRGEHGLERLPDDDQLGVARALIRESLAEDKFAGILYLQKYLVRRLAPDRLLAAAEGLFAEGAFFDWSTSDWFSVRVLAPLIRRGGMAPAERIAEWRTAGNLWQRRAAIVPFRAVVGDASFHPLIAATIAALAGERERFIQTGIGWVVSDLAKAHPRVAAALVERHFDDLSVEVIRRHTRYLPDHERYRKRKRGAPGAPVSTSSPGGGPASRSPAKRNAHARVLLRTPPVMKMAETAWNAGLRPARGPKGRRRRVAVCSHGTPGQGRALASGRLRRREPSRGSASRRARCGAPRVPVGDRRSKPAASSRRLTDPQDCILTANSRRQSSPSSPPNQGRRNE